MIPDPNACEEILSADRSSGLLPSTVPDNHRSSLSPRAALAEFLRRSAEERLTVFREIWATRNPAPASVNANDEAPAESHDPRDRHSTPAEPFSFSSMLFEGATTTANLIPGSTDQTTTTETPRKRQRRSRRRNPSIPDRDSPSPHQATTRARTRRGGS